jgi:hypothetical protein
MVHVRHHAEARVVDLLYDAVRRIVAGIVDLHLGLRLAVGNEGERPGDSDRRRGVDFIRAGHLEDRGDVGDAIVVWVVVALHVVAYHDVAEEIHVGLALRPKPSLWISFVRSTRLIAKALTSFDVLAHDLSRASRSPAISPPLISTSVPVSRHTTL